MHIFLSAKLARTSYKLEENLFEDIESLGRSDQPLVNNLSPENFVLRGYLTFPVDSSYVKV